MFGSRGAFELRLRAEANAHAWHACHQRDRTLAALIGHAMAGERFPPPPPAPGVEPPSPDPPATPAREALWLPPGVRTD